MTARRPGRSPRFLAGLAVGLVAVATALSACAAVPPNVPTGDRIRDTVPTGVDFGTAIEGGRTSRALDDPTYVSTVATTFTSVTPENQMKWSIVRPDAASFDFAPADQVADLARRNGQRMRGHTLLWHGGNPSWLTGRSWECSELRPIVKQHVTTLVSRYADVVREWDVANEILDGGANLRTSENPFIAACGIDIVKDAFRWAHEADPKARLFLTDYDVEGVNPKSDAYLALVKDLLAEGVPVHGFGIQAHLDNREGAPGSVQANLQRFADLGLDVAVTELDVKVPLPMAIPSQASLRRQADVYGSVLDACLRVSRCTSFTVWGFTDRYSWVPEYRPGYGSATLMTAEYEAKPALNTIVDRLKQGRR